MRGVGIAFNSGQRFGKMVVDPANSRLRLPSQPINHDVVALKEQEYALKAPGTSEATGIKLLLPSENQSS